MVVDGGQRDDEAALTAIRRICSAWPGAEEAALQDRPLFRVGKRRFALFNGLNSPPRPRWISSGQSLHFLADPGDLDALRQDERFELSPHHGSRGWLAIRLDGDEVDWNEVAELLEQAYRQVARPEHLARLDGQPDAASE